MSLSPSQLRRLRTLPSDGNRLRTARHMLELTQQQLANEIGITQGNLSELERRQYSAITIATARKFAEFFGCSIDDLFPVSLPVVS